MDFERILSHSTKKPKSIVKIVVSFGITLLVLWIFVVSRMEVKQAPKKVFVNDSTKTTMSLKESLPSGNSISIPADSTESTSESESIAAISDPGENESTGIFQNATTTFVILVGLLGGVLFFLSRKKKKGSTQSGDVTELGGHVIGQGAQLKFLEINNEVWVIGLTPGNMNLMQRIPKEFWNAHKEFEEEPESDDDGISFNDFMKPYYKNFRN